MRRKLGKRAFSVGAAGQFKSLADALRAVSPGDKLVLMDDVVESVTVDMPLTIEGQGAYIKEIRALSDLTIEDCTILQAEAAPGAQMHLLGCRVDGICIEAGDLRLTRTTLWGRGLRAGHFSRVRMQACCVEGTEVGVLAEGQFWAKNCVFLRQLGTALTLGHRALGELDGCEFIDNAAGIRVLGAMDGKRLKIKGGAFGIRTGEQSRLDLKNSLISGADTALSLAGDGDLGAIAVEENGMGLLAGDRADVVLNRGRFLQNDRAIMVFGRGRILGTRINHAPQGGIFVAKSASLQIENTRVEHCAPGLLSLSPRVHTSRCYFADNRMERLRPDFLGI